MGIPTHPLPVSSVLADALPKPFGGHLCFVTLGSTVRWGITDLRLAILPILGCVKDVKNNNLFA